MPQLEIHRACVSVCLWLWFWFTFGKHGLANLLTTKSYWANGRAYTDTYPNQDESFFCKICILIYTYILNTINGFMTI